MQRRTQQEQQLGLNFPHRLVSCNIMGHEALLTSVFVCNKFKMQIWIIILVLLAQLLT